MQKKSLLLAVAFFAVVAGACGGGDDAGPQAGGSPGAGGAACSPAGKTLQIAAKNLKFDKNCLAAPANEAFTIQFANNDGGVPHNVAILPEQGGHEHLFRGEIVNGVTETTYNVPALEAGTFYFHCDVHPNMNGTFVVA